VMSRLDRLVHDAQFEIPPHQHWATHAVSITMARRNVRTRLAQHRRRSPEGQRIDQ
jgi:hypothetical protein